MYIKCLISYLDIVSTQKKRVITIINFCIIISIIEIQEVCQCLYVGKCVYKIRERYISRVLWE